MRMDRVILGILGLGFALGALVAHSQTDLDSTPGLLAARAWLGDMDSGNFGRCYEEAAPMLRTTMTRVQWEVGLERTRGPLGVSISRKIRQASCTRGTQADPEAEICVVAYDTRFSNRPLGDEQVTVLRGADGSWRVASYQLR